MNKIFKNVITCIIAAIYGTAAAAQQNSVPAVVIDKPQTVAESSPRRYVGMIEAVAKVDIMPRISGNLLKMHFKEGELVKKGDLLYEFEDTTYKARVDALVSFPLLRENTLLPKVITSFVVFMVNFILASPTFLQRLTRW